MVKKLEIFLILSVFITTLICRFANAEEVSKFKENIKFNFKKASALGVLYVQKEGDLPCGWVMKKSQNFYDPLAVERIQEDFVRNNIEECDFTENQREEIELAIQMVTDGSVQVAGMGLSVWNTMVSAVGTCVMGGSMGYINAEHKDLDSDFARAASNIMHIVTFVGGAAFVVGGGFLSGYNASGEFIEEKEFVDKEKGTVTKTGVTRYKSPVRGWSTGIISGLISGWTGYGCFQIMQDRIRSGEAFSLPSLPFKIQIEANQD